MNLRISRRAALSLALASFFPWAAPLAQAQGTAARWPQQAVRFVVPFPAGSAPDVLIRHVGAKLGEKWGQGVIVDNKPGGSGVIGMNAILAAPADGHTFGFVQGSAISVAPSTIKGVTYDFNRDFVPVTLAAVAPFMLAVPANSPYKTLADFIAAARAKPQGIEVADNGRGTAPHLASAQLGHAVVQPAHPHAVHRRMQQQYAAGRQRHPPQQANAEQGGRMQRRHPGLAGGQQVQPGQQGR